VLLLTQLFVVRCRAPSDDLDKCDELRTREHLAALIATYNNKSMLWDAFGVNADVEVNASTL
jgi:hypothetical protein